MIRLVLNLPTVSLNSSPTPLASTVSLNSSPTPTPLASTVSLNSSPTPTPLTSTVSLKLCLELDMIVTLSRVRYDCYLS
jgi:hypothetical protein